MGDIILPVDMLQAHMGDIFPVEAKSEWMVVAGCFETTDGAIGMTPMYLFFVSVLGSDFSGLMFQAVMTF